MYRMYNNRKLYRQIRPYKMPEGMEPICWECKYAIVSSQKFPYEGVIKDAWTCAVHGTQSGRNFCVIKEELRDR